MRGPVIFLKRLRILKMVYSDIVLGAPKLVTGNILTGNILYGDLGKWEAVH